jgi:hypothetical protein
MSISLLVNPNSLKEHSTRNHLSLTIPLMRFNTVTIPKLVTTGSEAPQTMLRLNIFLATRVMSLMLKVKIYLVNPLLK